MDVGKVIRHSHTLVSVEIDITFIFFPIAFQLIASFDSLHIISFFFFPDKETEATTDEITHPGLY